MKRLLNCLALQFSLDWKLITETDHSISVYGYFAIIFLLSFFLFGEDGVVLFLKRGEGIVA